MSDKLIELLELVETDETIVSMRDAQKRIGVHSIQIVRLLNKSDAATQARYVRAKEIIADNLADSIVALSERDYEKDERGKIDPAEIQARKLTIDTIKWQLSKVAKKYSDRTAVELSGSDGGSIAINVQNLTDDQLARQISAKMALLSGKTGDGDE